ncbi:hypothetical protein AB0B94_31200 [Micromonospora sp. NPDC048986]|uniref:hypothetical protein n=1 Tax=Micromonospora sp. NPDC048986 TaxID=3155644 RepID=UPI0033DB3179
MEDLHAVVVMLHAAGAESTGQRREFVITAPLTPEQASAAWMLAGHTDNDAPMAVRVEPEGDLAAALDTMCPGVWDENTWTGPDDDRLDSNRWWVEQQAARGKLRRQAHLQPAPVAMPTPDAPPAPPAVEVREDGTCCGTGGRWAPKEGEPVVNGCQLCPNSMTYWRTTSTATR